MFELTLKMTIPNGDAAADFFPALGLAMQQLRGVGAVVDDETSLSKVEDDTSAPAVEDKAEKKPRKPRETKAKAEDKPKAKAEPEAPSDDQLSDDELIVELRKVANLIVKALGGETVRGMLSDRGVGKYTDLDTDGKRDLLAEMRTALEAAE